MNYQPKVIRCRLKTGGKTIQEIREKNKGQGMVYRDFENIKKTYDVLDGVVLLLSLWAYDMHASYHLHNWDPADVEEIETLCEEISLPPDPNPTPAKPKQRKHKRRRK